MESFVLSETLKVSVSSSWFLPSVMTLNVQYLFLLFDEDNPLHSDDSHYVFTTEGHILSLDRKQQTISSPHRKTHTEKNQCLAYSPITTARGIQGGYGGLVQGIRSHVDLDYSRELVALLPDEAEKDSWSLHGWCEKPQVDILVGPLFFLAVCYLIALQCSHTSLFSLQMAAWWRKMSVPVRKRLSWYRMVMSCKICRGFGQPSSEIPIGQVTTSQKVRIHPCLSSRACN
jgi:hypothetical protein